MVIKLLLPLLVCFPAMGQGLFVSWNRFVPAVIPCDGGVAPYIVWQGFEGSPFDHCESWLTNNSSGGVVNTYYSSAPLAGTKSLQISATGASQGDLQSSNFVSGTEFWFYFLFKPVTIQVGGFKHFFSVYDDSGTPGTLRWDVSLNDDGTVRLASTGTATTTGAMTAGTTYHVWVHIKSNVSMDVGFSTTGTRPTSGVNYVLMSGTTAAQNMHRIALDRDSGSFTHEFIWDNVLVKTSQIGDNPP